MLLVYFKGSSLPVYFFPWRLFQTRDAKKWAAQPDVNYVVSTTLDAQRPSKAFWNRHKKGSGHLRLLSGTRKVYVPKNAPTSAPAKRNARASKK